MSLIKQEIQDACAQQSTEAKVYINSYTWVFHQVQRASQQKCTETAGKRGSQQNRGDMEKDPNNKAHVTRAKCKTVVIKDKKC